jgi:hypothetical protein
LDFPNFAWLADRVLAAYSEAPWPLQILALLIPTMLALLSRSLLATLWVLPLNAVVILSLAVQTHPFSPEGALLLYAITYLGSFLGVIERRQRSGEAAASERMRQLGSQLTVFLEGLDRRARIIEEVSAKLKASSSTQPEKSASEAEPTVPAITRLAPTAPDLGQ